MSTCQACQRVCATQRVTLMQNIGFIVARQSKNFTADLCRECGLRMAKEMTLITFFFGWWGVISFILTPIILIGNVFALTKLSKLPPPDAPWTPPTFGDAGPSGPNASADAAYAGTAAPAAHQQAGPPSQQRSRAEKTGNQSLLVAFFGIVFFCVPLVSAAGLYMGWKAKRQADEDNTPMPKSAFAGMALSALALLMFAGSAALGFMGWRETAAKLEALHARADKVRTLATLDGDGACALVEERLAEDSYEGKSVNSVSCKGPLNASAERSELDGVTATMDSSSAALTACLRKSDRWFVAALEPCSQQTLGPKQAGLTPEKQEAAWREAEKQALSEERIAVVTRKLEAIRHGVEDGDKVKDCSSDIALGRTIPHKIGALGGDAPYRFVSGDATVATVDLPTLSGAPEKGWEFMTSKALLGVLDAHAGKVARSDSAKELLASRYLLVASGEIAHELPEVPAKSPGAAYEGGAFIGLAYLADLRTGDVLCAAPLVFENSDSISVTTYRGNKTSDSTVLSEAKKDFAQQYVTAVEKELTKALREAPMTAEADEAPKAAVKKAAPAPAPKAKKKK